MSRDVSWTTSIEACAFEGCWPYSSDLPTPDTPIPQSMSRLRARDQGLDDRGRPQTTMRCRSPRSQTVSTLYFQVFPFFGFAAAGPFFNSSLSLRLARKLEKIIKKKRDETRAGGSCICRRTVQTPLSFPEYLRDEFYSSFGK